jgi:cyclopropane fatty-acyl-phospholipid synthase-like methyltransferase
MIDSSKFLENFLQKRRFSMVKNYLDGKVLDFGGNEGELRPWVKGEYLLVNYDHSPMINRRFDRIISLAVIEHIEVPEVYAIFSKFKNCLEPGGLIFITTPTPASKPILEFLAWIGLLDKGNIREHKHYWNKQEIGQLAEKSGLAIEKYRKFQLGFNQYAVLKHK